MSASESSQVSASGTDWPLGGAASVPRNPPPADRFARHHRGDRSDAGFARWQGDAMEELFGNGFWGNATQLYFGSDLLVLGAGLYDWVTRKRLHAAYIAGVAWIGAVELTALSVYTSPGWAPIAQRLLSGH